MKKIEILSRLNILINDIDTYDVTIGTTSNNEVVEIIIKKIKW